jgi:hypothetical protein
MLPLKLPVFEFKMENLFHRKLKNSVFVDESFVSLLQKVWRVDFQGDLRL